MGKEATGRHVSDFDVARVFDDVGSHRVGEDVESYADLPLNVLDGNGLGPIVAHSARAVQHFVEPLRKATVGFLHVLGKMNRI